MPISTSVLSGSGSVRSMVVVPESAPVNEALCLVEGLDFTLVLIGESRYVD